METASDASGAQTVPKLNREIENVDVNEGKFMENATNFESASNGSEACSTFAESATKATISTITTTTEAIEGVEQLTLNHEGGKRKRDTHRKRNSKDK